MNHSLANLNKIAIALKIVPYIIYDDYFKFISDNYGGKIKQVRKDLNLTQKEFGRILDVNKKTIYKWEKEILTPGKDSYIKIKKLKYNSL